MPKQSPVHSGPTLQQVKEWQAGRLGVGWGGGPHVKALRAKKELAGLMGCLVKTGL